MLLARSSFVFMTIVTLFIPSTATTFEPKDLCDSLPDIPFPSSFSVSHKLRALVDVFDDASDLSWQSCGTNCDKAAHTFNATQTALAETSRALFSYTARLSVSTTMYVKDLFRVEYLTQEDLQSTFFCLRHIEKS